MQTKYRSGCCKHCPDCDRDKPAREFLGYNNRPLKRCQACRDRDRGYRVDRLMRTIAKVRRVECTICHERTVARTLKSGTLIGWRDVNLKQGRGVCHEHSR